MFKSRTSVLESLHNAIKLVTIASDLTALEHRVRSADDQIEDAYTASVIDDEEIAEFKLELALVSRTRRNILSH